MESLLLDARGNPFQGSLDSITGEVLTDARAPSSLLAALNAETLIDIHGKAVVMCDLRSAAFTGTVVFEGTIDGTNYVAIPAISLTTNAFIASIVSAGVVAGTAVALTATGFRRLRVRVSAYTSGNITVALRGSTADFLVSNVFMPVQSISATAAAATAVTLTIPAPAAGLFNYITSIDITRNATAALAGTATLVITTTNLPGTLAWSVGNAMAAGGTAIDVNKDYTQPLKSTTAATATTIVAPAPGAAVLWRLNANYYVGP
jgi:hypothetical protein